MAPRGTASTSFRLAAGRVEIRILAQVLVHLAAFLFVVHQHAAIAEMLALDAALRLAETAVT